MHKPRGSKGVWIRVDPKEVLRVTKQKGKKLHLRITPNINEEIPSQIETTIRKAGMLDSINGTGIESKALNFSEKATIIIYPILPQNDKMGDQNEETDYFMIEVFQ